METRQDLSLEKARKIIAGPITDGQQVAVLDRAITTLRKDIEKAEMMQAVIASRGTI